MTWILIFIVNFIVFVLSLIALTAAYFEARWKTFSLFLICALLTGTYMAVELDQWLVPPPPSELPVVIRQPPGPL